MILHKIAISIAIVTFTVSYISGIFNDPYPYNNKWLDMVEGICLAIALISAIVFVLALIWGV